MPFIHYFYVFLWAVLAVLCFFIGRKHGLVGYLLTVFFFYLCQYGTGLRPSADCPCSTELWVTCSEEC